MTATALAVAITAGMFGLWFGWTVGAMWATWTSGRRTPVSASSEHLFDGLNGHSVALRGTGNYTEVVQ